MAGALEVSKSLEHAALVSAVSGVLYTIPSLALFAVLVPVVGLGAVTAVIGLTTYALLILTRNVAAGFHQVPDAVVDAAVATGMGPGRILWAIELPLAPMPVAQQPVRERTPVA